MLKYLKLAWLNLKLSILREMEFRIDFVVWFLVDTGWGFIDLIFFTTLVNKIGSLGNWSLGEVFVVVGLFRLLAVPIWGWLRSSFSRLVKMISSGELDMVLVKPVDSQFGVSFNKFSINMVASIITGSAYIFWGLKLVNKPIILSNILGFGWLMIISLVLIYAMYFATVALSLFFDRLNNIQELFPHFADAARFPKEIYSGILQRIVTTIWPVALILAVPVETLFGRPIWSLILWMHIVTILFLFAGRLIWMNGLKHYSSASS